MSNYSHVYSIIVRNSDWTFPCGIVQLNISLLTRWDLSKNTKFDLMPVHNFFYEES